MRLTDMHCDEVRELVSAAVDGEVDAREGASVDAHLTTCADCRAWKERAHVLLRQSRVRASDATVAPDRTWLSALTREHARRGRWRAHARRALLGAASVTMLALSVPQLLSGDVDNVRDVATLEAALGFALLGVLLRPSRAPGVAAVAAPAGSVLVALELVAFATGTGSAVDLVRHLAALVGGAAAWSVGRRVPPDMHRDQLGALARVVARARRRALTETAQWRINGPAARHTATHEEAA